MKKKILFIATESLPFVKTGGLADVIGALPAQLAKENCEIRVVLPLYNKVANRYFEEMKLVTRYPIKYGGLNTEAIVYSLSLDNIVYYFIQHQAYFEREMLYGYSDDGERFGFFQRAALDLLYNIKYQPQIIHCHDWHTGMIPFMGKTQYPVEFKKIKYVYTIHNLAFQGIFPLDALWSCLGLAFDSHLGRLELNGCLNFMKAGIEFADKVTTVSPSYSWEIKTAEFGENLEGVLNYRQHDLWGIINGIDLDIWNPTTDKAIERNYSVTDYQKGKIANKLALQDRLGLRRSEDILLIGMVTRLTWQKGVYLLIDKMQKIMANDIQLVILGNGESYAESQFKKMEYDYRRRAVFYNGYDDDVARLIYSGSDLFLMPSLFEPCGISQLIAMRYGSLPLVRETGGLKDTVTPYNQFTKEGCGFSFSSYNSDDFMFLLNMAVDLYYQNRDDFNRMVENAMKVDSSWEKPAKLYCELYDLVLGSKS